MQSLKRLICLSIATTLLAAAVNAAEAPVFIRGIRPLGMGGAFVAISDDQNAMFYNPAGLTQRQGSQFVGMEMPLNVSEDTNEFYNFYKDNEEDLKNFDKLTDQDQIRLLDEINNVATTYRPRIRFGFPNPSYLSGNQFITWGVGIFDQAEIGFQFEQSLLVPTVSMFGQIDVIAAVPLAHRFDSIPYLPGKISVGTTLKAISRTKIDELNKSVLELENLDPQLQSGKGFGLDAGALYQPNSRWNVGMQITDMGGTTIKYDEVLATKEGQLDKAAYRGMIRSECNTGVAYIPSKIVYWPGKSISTKDRFIFAGDIRDILNSDERLFSDYGWKKVHLGAEMRWGMFSVRGGFNSGYPSFGGGLRIPYLGLRADYAYWADETGAFAGQLPEWNHQLTFAFSWGDSKGRPYGTDVKSESAIAQKKAEEPVPAQAAAPVVASGLTAPTTSQTILPPTTSTSPVTTPSLSSDVPASSPVSPAIQSPAAAPAAAPAATPAAVPVPSKPAAQTGQKATVTEKKK